MVPKPSCSPRTSSPTRRRPRSRSCSTSLPELPEVETVRRRLAPVLEGRRFEHVEIHDPRLTRPEDPLVVATELVGERVATLDRRGKYLIVALRVRQGAA